MVQSETRYCQKFWRKREKPFFLSFEKVHVFTQKLFLPKPVMSPCFGISG